MPYAEPKSKHAESLRLSLGLSHRIRGLPGELSLSAVVLSSHSLIQGIDIGPFTAIGIDIHVIKMGYQGKFRTKLL